LKGALDKLGIEPQIFYCGKFKSATEPLRATKMSEPNKIQTTAFMQTIYNSFMGEIASSRKIPFQRLDSISQNLLVRSASSAMQFHLVDKTLYYDQFLAELTANSKLINFDADNTDATNRIAVVFMNGDIVDGKGEKDNIGSEKFAEQLRKIRMDDSYKALVLRVNSPGGSALASDVMWREITLLKKKMPVIVSMGDYAASGGYYISCPADTIFAMPTTLTGSIGVFGILPCMEKFLNDKLGITNDGVKTGKYSDMPNLTRALTTEEKAIVQSGVDSIYIDFLSKVSAGRKQSRAVIDSIAQGRVWAGPAGINVHIVDRLGDLEQAIDCARKMAKLDKCQKVYLPKNEPKWTEMLVEAISESEETKIKTSLGDLYPVFKQVLWVKELKGVQARVPYVMELR
jgi:protease-4